jgi:hypothetical protein
MVDCLNHLHEVTQILLLVFSDEIIGDLLFEKLEGKCSSIES